MGRPCDAKKKNPHRKNTTKFCSYKCAGLNKVGKEFSEKHRKKLIVEVVIHKQILKEAIGLNILVIN